MKTNYRMSKVGNTYSERKSNTTKWYRDEIEKCGNKWWLQWRKKRLIDAHTRFYLAHD